MANTYTAIFKGRMFVNRGTFEQLQTVLQEGYCTVGRQGPDATGNMVLQLGIMVRKPDPWPRLGGRDLAPEFLGAQRPRAGQDY